MYVVVSVDFCGLLGKEISQHLSGFGGDVVYEGWRGCRVCRFLDTLTVGGKRSCGLCCQGSIQMSLAQLSLKVSFWNKNL